MEGRAERGKRGEIVLGRRRRRRRRRIREKWE